MHHSLFFWCNNAYLEQSLAFFSAKKTVAQTKCFLNIFQKNEKSRNHEQIRFICTQFFSALFVFSFFGAVLLTPSHALEFRLNRSICSWAESLCTNGPMMRVSHRRLRSLGWRCPLADAVLPLRLSTPALLPHERALALDAYTERHNASV